jgi:uncharacterized membrane protein
MHPTNHLSALISAQRTRLRKTEIGAGALALLLVTASVVTLLAPVASFIGTSLIALAAAFTVLAGFTGQMIQWFDSLPPVPAAQPVLTATQLRVLEQHSKTALPSSNGHKQVAA